MHFILEARVGIIVAMDDGRRIRVRSLGRHTTIGEMGLITRQMRSATIQAEVSSVLYELSADAYERLKRDNSALAQDLLTYIVRVMAERLSFASRVIGVLRRRRCVGSPQQHPDLDRKKPEFALRLSDLAPSLALE